MPSIVTICPPNFNPRSPHGERPTFATCDPKNYKISIHAPRTGSDAMDYVEYLTAKAISIHAPRTGSDRPRRRDAKKDSHFNPRSPHGERHTTIDVQGGAWVFQSTLPARGATGSRGMILMPGTFQSTLPARGATVAYSTCLLLTPYFNPRSPHGERRTPAFSDSSVTLFQSTLPARGATAHALGILRAAEISIHAPRTGSDGLLIGAGEFRLSISIHAPRTGSDDG